jgi:hypothetical protein
VATFLSREEWAKPRGRKSHQRRCGSDDRGAADLRPDQAINEATCVRVLNRNRKEKSWLISVVLSRGRYGPARKEKTICRRGGIVPKEMTEHGAPHHRSYVGQTEIGRARLKRSEEDRDCLSVKLDTPWSTWRPVRPCSTDDGDGAQTLMRGGYE